jgi:hypothetical protein
VFYTDSLWLREILPGYDEPLDVKQKHTTGTRPKGPLRVKGGCHGFETKVAALIGLRGLKRMENFKISFNRSDADNVVDIVYTADCRRYFIQPKHTDDLDENKLTRGELVAVLQKCYNSYCIIKHDKEFTDIPVDKTEFVIYTNRKLDPKLSQHTRQQTRRDIFFKTRDKEIFIFIPDSNKETDVYTILQNSLKGKKRIHGSTDGKMISEFFNKVIMVASVDGKCQLDDEIHKEIEEQDAMKVPHNMYKAELRYLKTRVANLLKNRKDVTSEMFRNWLQEAKTTVCGPFVKRLFVCCTKKRDTTGIHFAGSEISRLQAELSNKPAVHLRSNAPALCSILLMQCLPESKSIFVNLKSLHNDRSKLLHAWLGGNWQWCVVLCDSNIRETHISDMCLCMFSVMKPVASNKCLIILTPFSVNQIHGFSPINHKLKFEQPPVKSKTAVLDRAWDTKGWHKRPRCIGAEGPEPLYQSINLDRAVNIQGYLLTVKSILRRHGAEKKALRALGADAVSRLARQQDVRLESTLHTSRCYSYYYFF